MFFKNLKTVLFLEIHRDIQRQINVIFVVICKWFRLSKWLSDFDLNECKSISEMLSKFRQNFKSSDRQKYLGCSRKHNFIAFQSSDNSNRHLNIFWYFFLFYKSTSWIIAIKSTSLLCKSCLAMSDSWLSQCHCPLFILINI